MKTQNNLYRVCLLALLLIATSLTFHRLAGQSLWHDEGNSARLSERSIRLIIEGTASDIHPPLYYLLLAVWRRGIGASEWGLRSLSAFAGVIIVALTQRFCIQLGGRRRWMALVAATWVAFHPAFVYYSQEARMYTLLPLLGIAATVVWQHRPKSKRTLALYGALLVAGLYTHYFFPIILAIHGGMAIFQRRLRIWLGIATGALLYFLPWLLYVWHGMGGNRGVPQSWTEFGRELFPFLAWGALQPVSTFRYLPLLWGGAFVVGIIGIVIDLAKDRLQYQSALTLCLLMGLPVVALIFVKATDVAFFKFLLFVLPAVGSIWAYGVLGFGRIHRRLSLFAPLLILPILFQQLTTLRQLYIDPAWARDDYRGIVNQISAEAHPNAAIILNAPNQWEVFTYYHQNGAPVYPMPMEHDKTKIITQLEEIAANYRRLYLLYWGDQQQDPEHWIEQWLDQQTFKASEGWRGDIRFVTYAVPQQSENELVTPLVVRFGSSLELQGYSLKSAPLQAGDIIELSLDWQAIAPIEQRYKLFVHLLDANGVLVAQKDSEPTPMTSAWQVGALYRERVGVLLGENVVAGRYTLAVGWYDVGDPTQRLSISADADHLRLAEIDIK